MFQFANFFVVELTLNCNLKCEYCYLEGRHEYTGLTMTDEVFRSFIDRVIYNMLVGNAPTNPSPVFVLHGGEPLLTGVEYMRDKLQYMKEAFGEAELDYNVSVQTNGILLTEEFAELFAEYGVDLGISYDGSGTNDLRTKGNDNIEQKILNNIQKLKDADARFGVLSVITTENIDTIETFEEKLGSMVKRIRVTDTSTPNSTIETDPMDYYNKLEREYVESLDWVHLRRGNIHHDVDRMLHRAVTDVLTDHSDTCQNTCGFKFCGAGVRILTVEPNGAIHRCDRWDLKHREEYFLQKPFQHDFLAAHQLKRAVEWNETLHKVNRDAGCDTCYARYICGHQCQSLYYSKYGKYGVDKQQICARTKAIYSFVSENIESIIDEIVKRGYFEVIEDFAYGVKFRMNQKFQSRGYLSLLSETGDKLVLEEIRA